MTTKSKAPMSGALAQAIAHHKSAQAAFDAVAGLVDCHEPELEEETEALNAIALMPCASDAEFLEKLRYLHAYETRLSGPPDGKDEFGSVALAVDCHYGLTVKSLM